MKLTTNAPGPNPGLATSSFERGAVSGLRTSMDILCLGMMPRHKVVAHRGSENEHEATLYPLGDAAQEPQVLPTALKPTVRHRAASPAGIFGARSLGASKIRPRRRRREALCEQRAARTVEKFSTDRTSQRSSGTDVPPEVMRTMRLRALGANNNPQTRGCCRATRVARMGQRGLWDRPRRLPPRCSPRRQARRRRRRRTRA